MLDTSRPPLGLGLLRVTLLTRGRTSRRLASIVRVLDLLAGLDKLDKSFGNLAAVDLLEVLQSALVVGKDLFRVSDLQTNHVRSGGRHFFSGFGEAISMQVMGSAVTADTTSLGPTMRFIGVGVAIAERGSSEGGGACGGQ